MTREQRIQRALFSAAFLLGTIFFELLKHGVI